ncbi:MATE family efflux transporter [Reyranella sp. CPCC 100927]|uniref:MATE family efflux transporter n=1 Tax=Reyranella sp. CPCC 100927 TaxID=2599616 RepID=UPI0011B56398|nr:MATE family efflux transporter [Reyranella sp. CPCC 100927]TWS95919.1 MATE family efflux transporter [Reyranella sp. CPCC 100927]
MPVRADIRVPRAATILRLSWPVVVGLTAQNAMSLIAIAMVGRLGDVALAAVGVGGTLYATLLAVLFGLDTAVQTMVARKTGAQDMPGAAAVLADALPISLLAGAVLATLAYTAAPAVLTVIAGDPAVIALGTAYVRALCPTLLFMGAGFAFSAYWNGRGRPERALLAILVQLPCSVLFSYALIFGAFGLPRLDVAGAGLGAMLAALVALGVHLAVIRVPVRDAARRRPALSGMVGLLRLGLPVSLQQVLLYIGMSVFFAIVARLGVREVAAINVMIALFLISILAATGVGIAAATLVGQALGRHDISDAQRWGWQASLIGMLLVAPLSLAIVMAPGHVLALFIVDDTTIALAATPLRLLALAMVIDTAGRVLVFALRGAGAAHVSALVSFAFQWGAQLPLCWIVGVMLDYGLVGIAAVRLTLSIAESAVMAVAWRRQGSAGR